MPGYVAHVANSVLTVGRDLANNISLGDTGVSRSHGRIEWDKTGEFGDRGKRSFS